MARMILRLKENYLRQYPQGLFVVTIMRHPVMYQEGLPELFFSELKNNNIEFWEPTSETLIQEALRKGPLEIPGDGHPSALANYIYSKTLLNQFLQKKY